MELLGLLKVSSGPQVRRQSAKEKIPFYYKKQYIFLDKYLCKIGITRASKNFWLHHCPPYLLARSSESKQSSNFEGCHCRREARG